MREVQFRSDGTVARARVDLFQTWDASYSQSSLLWQVACGDSCLTSIQGQPNVVRAISRSMSIHIDQPQPAQRMTLQSSRALYVSLC